MTAIVYRFFRTLAFVLPVVCVSPVVRGEELQVLWWEVWPEETTVSKKDGSVIGSPTEEGEIVVYGETYVVNGARIRATNPSTGDFEYVLLSDDDTSAAWLAREASVPGQGYANVSSYASGSPEYLFAIEIGNWDEDSGIWTGVAVSESASYSALRNGGHIADWEPGSVNPSGSTFWAPTAYTVPEPTSALLLLMGVALLGLRRRVGA